MSTIWLGRFTGYPWAYAFSTAEKARAWMLADDGPRREIAETEVDVAASPNRERQQGDD